MGFIDYKNQPWTKDNTTLMALYYLGVGSNIILPFKKVPNSDKVVTNTYGILPTISPNDPNFKKMNDARPSLDDDQ